MKLSKSESGKLGAIASKIAMAEISLKLRENYLLSPSLCRECTSILSYEKRKHKFCSHKCAATFSNRSRKKPKIIKNSRFEISITKIESGNCNDRKTIKKYLIKIRGHKCEVCHLSTWIGFPIPLELDHIDGNASSNFPINLRLICPNCHAQTPTAKGRNRGKGRKSLGLPVH